MHDWCTQTAVSLTDSLNALRLKNALHDSHDRASKLQPSALSPQTTHNLSDLTCLSIVLTRFIVLLHEPLLAAASSQPFIRQPSNNEDSMPYRQTHTPTCIYHCPSSKLSAHTMHAMHGVYYAVEEKLPKCSPVIFIWKWVNGIARLDTNIILLWLSTPAMQMFLYNLQ